MTHANPLYESGQDIRDRTFEFGCSVVAVCEELLKCGGVGRMLAPQLLGSSTSVAAMLEEARESLVRLRIMVRCRVGKAEQMRRLCVEANELVAIITAIIRNTRQDSPTLQGSRRRIPHP